MTDKTVVLDYLTTLSHAVAVAAEISLYSPKAGVLEVHITSVGGRQRYAMMVTVESMATHEAKRIGKQFNAAYRQKGERTDLQL